MNKKELAQRVAERTGLSQVKALEVLNTVFDADAGVITNTLVTGERVTIPGFGTFKLGVRASRKGTNPGTGTPMVIPARPMISFKPGRNFEQRLAAQVDLSDS